MKIGRQINTVDRIGLEIENMKMTEEARHGRHDRTMREDIKFEAATEPFVLVTMSVADDLMARHQLRALGENAAGGRTKTVGESAAGRAAKDVRERLAARKMMARIVGLVAERAVARQTGLQRDSASEELGSQDTRCKQPRYLRNCQVVDPFLPWI